MLKHLLLLALAVAGANAEADVFMCKQANGKVEFSDTPCKAGASSHVIRDTESSPQQQDQGAATIAPKKHRDHIKPDRVLSPEETNPPPVHAPGYIKPNRALSPEETNPPPVRSLDYTKPDKALAPD